MSTKMQQKKRQVAGRKLMKYLVREMEKCKDVSALNDNVIIPFILALENTADARSYVLNIYGRKSNLVFTNEEDSEAIYNIVEEYLDKLVPVQDG